MPNEKEKTKEPYFFAGGMEYKPVEILATSREDAEAQWLKIRQPVAEPETQKTTPNTNTEK